MNFRVALILSLLCGTMMPYAFAPYHWVFLALLGFGGWLFFTIQQPKHAFKLGWAFGFGWFGGGGWWLADTFQVYGHLPYAIGLMAVAVLGLILGLFFAIWGWGMLKLSQSHADILWLFPVIGVLEEWLRTYIFTGLPWTAIGNLAVDTPFSSWLSIVGSYGTTFVLLLFTSAITLLFSTATRKHGIIGVLICIPIFVLSPQIDVPEQPSHTVALIQPNVPQDQKWDAAFLQDTMFTLTRLSEQASDTDLIIWPEAAVPMYLSHAPAWNTWLKNQVISWNTPLIFGGLKYDPKSKKSKNGLYLDADGKSARRFVGKHHLVPFGEYVPSWLPWLGKMVPDIGDFEQAQDNGILTLGEQRFGSIICYESIFSDEAAARVSLGANVLIVVTNDAWYDQSPAAWQHLQASQVRAIETGRYVLRATNTGVTAIISPDGNIQATMPWWQAGFVRAHYQPLTHTTSYQQWGDKPILIIVFLGLGFGLFRFNRGRR